MKKTIAVYKRIGPHEYQVIEEMGAYHEESMEFVRLTEPLEAEFTQLDRGVTVNEEIESLREMQETVRAAAGMKLQEFEDKIKNLLAITHDDP